MFASRSGERRSLARVLEPTIRRLGAPLALAAISWLMADPVAAAVRLCHEEAIGDRIEAPSEVEARRAALASWVAIAGGLGPGYTRWAIAWGRRLECVATSIGHACQASGRPCTVSQVPPEGLPILRREVPARD